jgi:putative GTP pyrophosphokinase
VDVVVAVVAHEAEHVLPSPRLLVVHVTVYLVNSKKIVPVEIQFRSIAMDAFASLEHELRYKNKGVLDPEIVETLKDCAETLHDVDERMAKVRHEVLRDENEYSDY